MFDSLEGSKPDGILALMLQYRADDRPDKLDLGVGVYKDADGHTPIMQAVQVAERKVMETQVTKSYVSPTGDQIFCQGMSDLILGAGHDATRVRALQTPGGSGALRILSDLLHAAAPDAVTWIPDPTWPNHIPMLMQADHRLKNYSYYNASTHQLDFDAMMGDLATAQSGDIVLLHGCCHNPTGADLEPEHWQAIGELCVSHNLLPFIDLAYLGFANGLEEDATGVRSLFAVVPEMVIASSCSKNLGLYRERTGAALLIGRTADAVDRASSRAISLIRACYSMPPDHGAAVTREIFQDPELKSIWKTELEFMRTRMQRLRQEFAAALRKRGNSDKYDYIVQQKGMFSRLPLTLEQIDTLRNVHGIYLVGDGRMSVAGLPENGLDQLASTVIEVTSNTMPAYTTIA